ncbi:MAG: transketolase [Spirochaetaceae bacterium]|nr:MAG: transketolase [Spirochaetaceae bacterium]
MKGGAVGDDWIGNKAEYLLEKVRFVREQTLEIHRIAQGTRIASSLSCIEVLVALYYGGILNFNASNPRWEKRDRFIVSKVHGSIALYPILADLGFFPAEQLGHVASRGSILGAIPDCIIPGYETTNGSLGHGLGVACGMATALQCRKAEEKVFVMAGDGELFEGAVWEAIMFAGEHCLGNLILVVDANKVSMLDYCRNIIDLEPYSAKFQAFKWEAHCVNGHNLEDVYKLMFRLKHEESRFPRVVIANTIKGKGIPALENDSLCHIKNVPPEQIGEIIRNWRKE